MKESYRFGHFELLPDSRQLLADGDPVNLGSRAFDLLRILVERQGNLVTKNELLDHVWPGLVVEENNLAAQVAAIRKAIGREALATIPGLGYRFAVPVEPAGATDRAPLAVPVLSPRGPLIGRDAELEELRQLIGSHALVTITGPGGIGKTRLAAAYLSTHEAQSARTSGWVELAPLSDGSRIPGAIASALQVPLDGKKAPLDALAAALKRKSGLVVLDNGEHVIDELAQVVSRLQEASPLRVLVTSREPLKVAGEAVYRMEGLAIPRGPVSVKEALSFGAIELFVARAREADRRFELTDQSIPAAVSLCRRLDGMPLAIELAASRAPLLGIGTLLAKLEAGFQVLGQDRRAEPARHRTILATIDWSYDLLGPAEQGLFDRLAVFSGGFSLEAASAMGYGLQLGELEAGDVLAQLIDKSMVVANGADPPRYSLLETLRAYGLEKLRERGTLRDAQMRHAAYFAELYAVAHDAWMIKPEAEWRRPVRGELDNVIAAMDWSLGPDGDRATALKLASAALPVGLVLSRPHIIQIRHLVDRALDLVDASTDPRTVGRLWFARAMMYAFADATKALAAHERALPLLLEAGDERGVVHTLIEHGRELIWSGELDRAAVALERAGLASRSLGAPAFQGMLDLAQGFLDSMRGDPRAAGARARVAVRFFEESGAWSLALQARNDVGDADWATGDLEHAEAGLREAVRLIRGTEYEHADIFATPVMNLAAVLIEKGDLAEAMPFARLALPIQFDAGREWGSYDALSLRLGLLGKFEDAARLHGRCMAEYRAAKAVAQPNEARLRARLLEHLRRHVDEATLARLIEEGGRMTAETAFDLAMRG